MKKGLIFLFAVSALCSGCSTAVTHLGAINPCHGHQPPAYSGVRRDARLLTDSEDGPKPSENRVLVIGYSLIDFPFSALGDTLLLPVDLANAD